MPLVASAPSKAEYNRAKAIIADDNYSEDQKAGSREVVAAYEGASKQPGSGASNPAAAQADEPVISAPRMRAKFIVSEITQTARGVSVITLAAAHDPERAHTGGIGAPVRAAAPVAPAPKGSISLEVSPEYAAGLVLGAAYYLVSA
jgi:hypothetical protein